MTLAGIEFFRRAERALDGRGYCLMNALVHSATPNPSRLLIEFSKFKIRWDEGAPTTPHTIVALADLRALFDGRVPTWCMGELSTWGDRRIGPTAARRILQHLALPVADDEDALHKVASLCEGKAYDRRHPPSPVEQELNPAFPDIAIEATNEVKPEGVFPDDSFLFPSFVERDERRANRDAARRDRDRELKNSLRLDFKEGLLTDWRGKPHEGVNPKWFEKLAPLLDLADNMTTIARVGVVIHLGTGCRVPVKDMQTRVERLTFVERRGGTIAVPTGWFGSFQAAKFWEAVAEYVRFRAA